MKHRNHFGESRLMIHPTPPPSPFLFKINPPINPPLLFVLKNVNLPLKHISKISICRTKKGGGVSNYDYSFLSFHTFPFFFEI